MRDIDRYRGCLIGGAIGDALGYPVEFKKDYEIFRIYGEKGITEYPSDNDSALFSDDTQMTLFTANGLLLGKTNGLAKEAAASYPQYILLCYKDWLKTQTAEDLGFEAPDYSWLNNIPEMNHSREPGRTCINYLMHENPGSIAHPKNASKGCGGIMRAAPVGLYFDENSNYTNDETDLIGAQSAALTHGHELGYIPAAMLVHIIRLIAFDADISLLSAVEDAKQAMINLFGKSEHLHEMIALVDKAIQLAADNTINDIDAIRQLGQGWVAEETLAIAIYASLKYEDSFEKAIIAAVNHSGDSDSTGAVTGNILGAYLGMKAIPKKFLSNLELKETILEIADDLYTGCESSKREEYYNELWERKYIRHTYPD